MHRLPQTYLVGVRGHTAKGITYALIHSWLVYGCGGSFWMAYWRGGGIVPGAGDYKRSDEEARVADEGLKADVETFVLGRRSGEEEVAPPVQSAETERLLEGDEDAAHAHSHRGQSRRFLQVKSDGTARFCRKVRIISPPPFLPPSPAHDSTARSATFTSPTARTTARPAGDASSRWTTTAPG